MFPFDSFDSFGRKLGKLTERIKKIEQQIVEESYDIYFSHATINNYLELVIKKQTNKDRSYFPSKEDDIKKYFYNLDPNFDYSSLKYSSNNDLPLICKIIGDQGISGYSYLENVDNVINLNKPTLMFYGIEHLAAYFRNLYFNFTDENQHYNQIKKKFHRHGIDSFEFKNLQTRIKIDELLEKKIKLKLEGLCPSFFLVFLDNHYTSLIEFFTTDTEISLIELLRNFFYVENEYIPDLIHAKFQEEFGKEWPNVRLKSTVLTLYLLTFIFSHISRYKLNIWAKIFESTSSNLSFYINFILKFGRTIFIKLLFERIFYNEMGMGGTIHYSIIDR